MFKRISPAVVLLGTAALVLGGIVATAHAATEADLADRLKFGLQARRPQELAFVSAVVDTVNRGELPIRLVDRTFFWARDRAPKRGGKFLRRPIIYFTPALQIQADELGIEIRRN
ncbi:MAG: hypothetical protein AAGJ46_15200 [Planctomycetota bacterium]